MDLSRIGDALDIACGPGEWVLHLAHVSPQIQVRGIDVNETMIRFACDISRQVPNAHFRLMDATRPLDFPDGSFDLVHARYMDDERAVPVVRTFPL